MKEKINENTDEHRGVREKKTGCAKIAKRHDLISRL
jgi:hypothetical protein